MLARYISVLGIFPIKQSIFSPHTPTKVYVGIKEENIGLWNCVTNGVMTWVNYLKPTLSKC